MGIVLARWEDLDGYAVAHGMPDLRKLPLGRLCNYVYWRVTDKMDQQALDKFRAKLWMPPKGVVADERSPWSAKNETAGFAALQAQVGQKATSGAAPKTPAT